MSEDRKPTVEKLETSIIARDIQPLGDAELDGATGGMLTNAFSNVIKAIGEGITKMASNQ